MSQGKNLARGHLADYWAQERGFGKFIEMSLYILLIRFIIFICVTIYL